MEAVAPVMAVPEVEVLDNELAALLLLYLNYCEPNGATPQQLITVFTQHGHSSITIMSVICTLYEVNLIVFAPVFDDAFLLSYDQGVTLLLSLDPEQAPLVWEVAGQAGQVFPL